MLAGLLGLAQAAAGNADCFALAGQRYRLSPALLRAIAQAESGNRVDALHANADGSQDNRGFDLPFLSWADPTWNDDALALMLTPYAYPFAGIAAVASEMPDAMAASTGFPLAPLFWVAGAWGPMYPLTGNVASATTPEQVSHLLLARLLAKLHAAGAQQSTAGQAALQSCGAMGVPEPIMDKRQYKTNRVLPFPDGMCTPLGRPLGFQERGAARPWDKDYGYFVFQRKDCCQPYPN